MAINYLTIEGLKKLQADVEHLRNVERPAISRQIAEARDKGDLSENAEYDAAKEAQGLLELKISKLQDILANAQIIDESKIGTSNVQLLNKVTIRNLVTRKEMTYTIVAETEANLKENKLSIETPIAKALLGKKKGDKVDIVVPSGNLSVEILNISI